MDNNYSYTTPKEQFEYIFSNKGNMTVFTEKSAANIENLHADNNKEYRTFHFAVGHKFKDIPAYALFQKEHVNNKEGYVCHDFNTIYKPDKETIKSLCGFISCIRNINSHYIHTFDKVCFEENKCVEDFIKDSFRLAVTAIILEKKNKWAAWNKDIYNENREKVNYSADIHNNLLREQYAKYKDSEDFQKQFSKFMKDKFGNLGTSEETLSIDECINKILFIDVNEEIKWSITKQSDVLFNIKKGRYPSFWGMLFLATMFLYKDEAELLVSQLDAFKIEKKVKDKNKNHNEDKETEEERENIRYKRKIFTFFSKKRSSQDYDSEEKSLIYFRDIIQYLGKYPTEWNKSIDLDNEDNNGLTEELKKGIESIEKDRILNKQQKNEDDLKEFDFETFFSQYRDIKVNDTDNKDHTKQSDDKENKDIETLKTRLEQRTFYTSYGRNQDRFMEFAARFLAEINYFGKDAKFKMYRFYTTDEQNENLKTLEEVEEKKTLDKLKYHRGKLTRYITYEKHKDKYPYWDTPFVIENNSVSVIFTLEGNSTNILLNIQRALMVYFLQDALFHQKGKSEGAGLILMKDYYDFHKESVDKMRSALKNKDNTELAEMKKLLPRRAVKKVFNSESFNSASNTWELILQKTELEEERYKRQKENKEKTAKSANDPTVILNFQNKNKGKQFKLRFINKAWNIMFFKDVYISQRETADEGRHHKAFHITRDEYNDFCRYMFAFDSVAEYKDLLRSLLSGKHFLENEEFKKIFEEGKSLDDFYVSTKEAFKAWTESQDNNKQSVEDKYLIENYKSLSGNGVSVSLSEPENRILVQHLFVNISHFIKTFYEKRGYNKDNNEKHKYPELGNKDYLISTYYGCKDKMKGHRRVYKKLQTALLEDCLLYEMAFHYWEKNEEVKEKIEDKNVRGILKSKLYFNIKEKGENINNDYTLIVPFKQVDKYLGMMNAQKDEKNGHRKFLPYAAFYLKLRKDAKSMEEIHDRMGKKKELLLEDLNKIYKDLVCETNIFLRLYMALERYMVHTYKLTIKEDNRITYHDIKPLSKIVSPEQRNIACHLNVPIAKYCDILEKIKYNIERQEWQNRGRMEYNSLLEILNKAIKK